MFRDRLAFAGTVACRPLFQRACLFGNIRASGSMMGGAVARDFICRAMLPRVAVVDTLKHSLRAGSRRWAAWRRKRMMAWRKVIGWTLLLGVAAMVESSSVPAATSASLEIFSNDGANEPAGVVELGRLRPLVEPNQSEKPAPTGNPLWSIPLSALSATRERPIFSASRRPPQAAVVAPMTQVIAPPPPKVAPPRPPLALIGAVVGEGEAIAIFLDQTSQKIIRLRQGESLAGWELSAVQSREVMLKQDERTEILALPQADDRRRSPGATVASEVESAPGLTVPAAGAPFFVPFVPRSTPKNGESDGL
jgi:general secretion pathway protein N